MATLGGNSSSRTKVFANRFRQIEKMESAIPLLELKEYVGGGGGGGTGGTGARSEGKFFVELFLVGEMDPRNTFSSVGVAVDFELFSCSLSSISSVVLNFFDVRGGAAHLYYLLNF